MTTVKPVSRDILTGTEQRLMDLKSRYLEEHGWVKSLAPGGIVCWEKIYRDKIYIANLPFALSIEEALSPE